MQNVNILNKFIAQYVNIYDTNCTKGKTANSVHSEKVPVHSENDDIYFG